MKTKKPIEPSEALDWHNATTSVPMNEETCVVVFSDGNAEHYRAPVYYDIGVKEWFDEWGHSLDVLQWRVLPELNT